jgi:hypothetical protein
MAQAYQPHGASNFLAGTPASRDSPPLRPSIDSALTAGDSRAHAGERQERSRIARCSYSDSRVGTGGEGVLSPPRPVLDPTAPSVEMHRLRSNGRPVAGRAAGAPSGGRGRSADHLPPLARSWAIGAIRQRDSPRISRLRRRRIRPRWVSPPESAVAGWGPVWVTVHFQRHGYLGDKNQVNCENGLNSRDFA